MDKTILRSALKEKYETSDRSVDKLLEKRILELDIMKSAKVIFLPISFGFEVETRGMIKQLLKDQKTVCVPKCISKTQMVPVQLLSLDELVLDFMGILTSSSEVIISKDQVDVCLCPGLAFSEDGYRLGYGAGFYDRFLADFGGISLGYCRDEFILKSLPKEDFDIPVNILLSERRTL